MKLKTELKKQAQSLQQGIPVVVSRTITSTGESIVKKQMDQENGKIYLSDIHCTDSKELGLGDCDCKRHPSRMKKIISPEQAMQILTLTTIQKDQMENFPLQKTKRTTSKTGEIRTTRAPKPKIIARPTNPTKQRPYAVLSRLQKKLKDDPLTTLDRYIELIEDLEI